MIKFKTMTIACAGMICCLTGCTQQSSGSYTISGEIEGLPEGAHIQLLPVSHNNEKPAKDTLVTDGKFVFKGVADEPRAMRLMVKDAYGSTPLMLENTTIRIKGKVIPKEQDGAVHYDFSSLSLSGSPLTDKYRRLLTVRERLDSLYQANNEQYKEIRAAYAQAWQAKDKQQMETLAATDAYKASVKADSLFFATVEATYYQTVMENKESFWGPLMMISLFSYLTEEQLPWFEALSPEAQASYYGQMVKEEICPTSKEGTRVPDFTAKGKEGETVSLEALCKGKKYILIDFWASWCKPCRKEIPNLKRLYASYADKGFQIVSISIDKKEAEWTKALQEEQLAWPNFLDTEGIADLYQVKFVPTMYLIDGQGVMVGENLRGEALADKLAELLGNG